MANKLWEKKLALAQASLGVSADEMSDPFYRSHVEKVASLYPDSQFEVRDPTRPDTPAQEANKHVAGWLTSDWLPEAGKAGVGMLDMVANVATAAGDYAGSDVLKNAGRSTSRVLGRYTDIYSNMQSEGFKQRLGSEDLNATQVGSTILHAIPQIPLFLAGGWVIGGLGAAAKLGTIATGAGKATQIMARLAGKGAAQATAMGARVNTGARLVGTYGATNTVIGAADTHREAYDEAMRIISESPEAKDFTSAEQENIALSLAREAANRQMPVAFITGAIGLGGAVGAVKAAAGKGSILKAMAKGAAIDAIPEGAEEGAQGYNVNVTLKQIDPSRDPFQGVATRAVLGAIAGGVLGGGMAGVERVEAGYDRADRLDQVKQQRQRTMYSRQLAAEIDAATNATLAQVQGTQLPGQQPPPGAAGAAAATPAGIPPGAPPAAGGIMGLPAQQEQTAAATDNQLLIPPLPGRPQENEQAWSDYLLHSAMVSDAEDYLNKNYPDWSNEKTLQDALDEDLLSDAHLNLEAAAGNAGAKKTLLVRQYLERKAAMAASQEIAEKMDEEFMTTRPSDLDEQNVPMLMEQVDDGDVVEPFFNDQTNADTKLIPGLWDENGNQIPPGKGGGKNIPTLMEQVDDQPPVSFDESPLMAPGAEDPGDLYRNSKKITEKPTSTAVLVAQRLAGKRMQNQGRDNSTWDDFSDADLAGIDEEIDSLSDEDLMKWSDGIDSPSNAIVTVLDAAGKAAGKRQNEIDNDESIDDDTQAQQWGEVEEVRQNIEVMKKRFVQRRKEARATRDANKQPPKKDGEPTDKQKEAGNYKKEHIRMHGLDIAIENARGSVRRGKDENGREWENELAHDYGYIKRTEGNDGDHVDVFIGPNLTSEKVFVVNQTHKNGKFDEHKVMFGFSNEKAALEGYLANYDKGWDNYDGIVPMSVEQFKSWLEDGSQKKPVRDGWKPDAKPGEWADVREDLEMQDFFTGEGASKFLARVERGSGKYLPQFSIPGYRENQWFPGTFDEANDINVPEFDTAEEARAFVEKVEKAFRSGGNKAVDAVLAKEDAGKPDKPPADDAGDDYKKAILKKGDTRLIDVKDEKGNTVRVDARVEKDYSVGDQNDGDDVSVSYSKPNAGGIKFATAKASDLMTAEQAVKPNRNPKIEVDGTAERKFVTAEYLPEITAREITFGEDNKVKDQRRLYAVKGILRIFQHKNPTYVTVETADGTVVAEAPGLGMDKAVEKAKAVLIGAKWSEKHLVPYLVVKGKVIVIEHLNIDKNNAELAASIQADVDAELEAKNQKKAKKDKPKKDKPEVTKNVLVTDDAAEKARAVIRAALGRTNAGLDPELAKAGMTLAVHHIEKGARTFVAYAKAMLADMGEMVRPYLKSWYMAAKYDPAYASLETDGAAAVDAVNVDEITADEETDEETETASLAGHFKAKIDAGEMPKDNPALKKLVAEFDGSEPDGFRMKEAQEDLETAIAMKAREIIAEGRSEGDTFMRLVSLYGSQPNLNARTSTSVENQAYSTPAPLAYLAGLEAGITKNSTVYEPTAGNGMLLITATPENVKANEIEKRRLASLRSQGFDVSDVDATQAIGNVIEEGEVDVVITNPPFGGLKDGNGKPIKIEIDGYTIGKIDHQIVAESLRAMSDGGGATLIIAADKVTGNISTEDRVFFNWLYGNYNVVGHYEVDGKLYSRQGASWPVRVITINGRKKSARVSPRNDTIARANTWEQVYEQHKLVGSVVGEEAGAGGGAGDTGAGVEGSKPPRTPGSPGKSGSGSGGRGGRGGSSGGSGNAPGTTGGAGNESAGDGRGTGEQQDLPGGPGDGGVGGGKTNGDNVGGPGTGNAPGPARAPVEKAESSDFQAPYVPQSSRKDEDVLVPINMAQPLKEALEAIDEEVGGIDKYLQRELQYDSVEEMHKALMGLQVDSVAAAIYQMKKGGAIVIADQTGIGKGRQAAAIIRWAKIQGKIPVFMTVKESLFSDMYRDLVGIGSGDTTPFIFNHDGSVITTDDNGVERSLFENPSSSTRHSAAINAITASGSMPPGTDAIFLTYSQIQKTASKRAALSAIAGNSIIILDEAHTAAGESSTGEFMRGIVEMAGGVTYLSATWAKRADNIPLYYRTDLRVAGDSASLIDAMKRGGPALQTVVSNMLTKAGQMFRRERSFKGISIRTVADTKNRVAHEEISDTITSGLREILMADSVFNTVFMAQLSEQVAEEGETIIDGNGKTVSTTVESSTFASVVHNFISQLLLAIKVDAAAEAAVKAIENGERPVIALQNTMESFLEEFIENNELSQGDSLGDFDYRTVLSRALARTRRVTIKDPRGKKSVRVIELDELDPETREAYDKAQDLIDGLDIGELPVSPIDMLRKKITDAGYTVKEISGRKLSVRYSDAGSFLSSRDKTERTNSVRTVNEFNTGTLHCLIINASGSTGISLHSSSTFADTKPRKMIVVQPSNDINIFMQTLGRVNRTGQVNKPSYLLLTSDIPAETRPAAVLSKKMKMLNANTSSNTESETSIDVPDINNKYGDEIVKAYLAENTTLRLNLFGFKDLEDDGLAQKATGKLAIMPVEVQRAFYEDILPQYQQMIDYLDQTNQNDLVPKTINFNAELVNSRQIFEGDAESDSPFAAPSLYNEMMVDSQGKRMTLDEVNEEIQGALDGKQSQDKAMEMVKAGDASFAVYYYKHHSKDEDGNTKSQEVMQGEIRRWLSGESPQENRDSITRAYIWRYKIGTAVRIELDGQVVNGVIIGVKSNHKEGVGSPYASGKFSFVIALNSSMRKASIPLSKFMYLEPQILTGSTPANIFGAAAAPSKEIEKIITGNLISAYAQIIGGTRGTIINFTMADGTVVQGIRLPQDFDPKAQLRDDYKFKSAADVVKCLTQIRTDETSRFGYQSRSANVRLLPVGPAHRPVEQIKIQVMKDKKSGGHIFLNQSIRAITGDFVKTGNFFVAYVSTKDAEAVVKIIMATDALYGQPSQMAGIRAMLGEKEPEVIKNKPVSADAQAALEAQKPAEKPVEVERPANTLGFEPGVDKHTQTGADLFTAKPSMRTTEEQYARVKDIARDYGGYWNKFIKKFVFPTAQFRDSFIEEFTKQQRSGSVRFKLRGIKKEAAVAPAARIADIGSVRRTPAIKAGMDRMVVEDMMARKLKGWKDAPLIEVIQTEAELPAEVLQEIEAKGYQGQVSGVFHGDRVYMVADNIKSEADLEDTFVHEAVGHLGMRKLMGKKYEQFLRNVLLSYAGTDTLKRISIGYGYDIRDNKGPESDAMKAADELVAHLSETGDRPGLLKQLIAMFKDWLLSKGFNGSWARFTDNDIRALIAAAERRMQKGKMLPSFSMELGRTYSMDMHRLRQKHLDEVVTRTAAMWKAFGRHKWTAQFAIPKGRALQEIASEIDFGITVGPVTDKATLRKAGPGEEMLKVSIPGGGSALVVTNRNSGEVYVDASLMSPGKGGASLYQMVLAYAYNNGLVFIGDPRGVSPTAIIRRTEQMISSAIKMGTTRHMRPAMEQVVTGHFSPGMTWKDGDHENNLKELILSSYDSVTRYLPEVSHVYYDHISRNFVYRRPGARVISAAEAADRAAGKNVGAGAGAAGAGRKGPAGDNKTGSAGAGEDLDWLNQLPYGGVLTDVDLERLGRVAGKRFREMLNAAGKSTFGDENPIGRTTIARAALSNTALRSGSLADWRQVLAEIVSELNQPVESDVFSGIRYRKAAGEPVPKGQETTRFRITRDKLFNPMSPKTFTMNDEALTDTIIRKVQDKYLRLKRVQAEVEAKWGDELPASMNAYRREELMHERAATLLRTLEEKHVKPLVESMGKQGITIGDLDAYLYAKHAFDRNAYIATINSNMPDGGSGITNDIAQGWLDDLDAEGKLQKCEELAKRVYAMNEARLNIIESAGLEDPKVIGNWRKSLGDYYVPLKGVAGEESQEFIRRVGSGLGVKGKESQAALGRRTIAESPLLNSIAQIEETVIRSEKNRVAKSFAAMVRKFPDPELWEIVTPSNQQIRYFDAETREVSWRNDYALAHRKDIFSFKENGREVLIRVKDPLLLQAMNNLGPEKLNGLMRFLGGINRKLAALNTSLNPEFVIGNFARDFQAALMALESESAKKGGLIHGQKVIAKTIASMGPAMRGIRTALRDPDNIAGNKWAQDFEEMRQVGGTTGFFGLKGMDEKKAEIESMLKEANGDWSKVPRKAFRNVRDLIFDYNSVVENAARLSAYVVARDTLTAVAEAEAAASGQKVSPQKRMEIREKSASLAKNLTVNFNRQGEWGVAANSLYLFANASIQGTARFAQVMASKRGAVIGTSLAVISLALAELNRILAGDDDDDRNFYDKVPTHIKERNLVLMDPFNPGEYMTFPLPYGYNIFNALGNAASDIINGKPVGKISTSLAGSFMGSFSPLGAESSDDMLTMGTKLVSPTILDPAIQLVANENFFGQPIYNEGYKYSVERPASALYWRGTGETAKFMASWLNEVSGGTPYRPGSIDVSPDAIEHLFDFATGGAGAFVRRTGTWLEQSFIDDDAEPVEADVIPFVRRLSGKVSDRSDQAQYYDRRDTLKQFSEEWKAVRLDKENPAKAEAWRKEYAAQMSMFALNKTTENRLRDLRDDRRRIESRSGIPDNMKRAKLKEIDAKINEHIDRFNKEYNKQIGED